MPAYGSEADIDAAIDASFPASDPPSHSAPVAATLAGDARITLYRVIDAPFQDGVLPLRSSLQENRWAPPYRGMIRMATSMPMAILDFLARPESHIPPNLVILRSRLCADDIENTAGPGHERVGFLDRRSIPPIDEAWARSPKSRMALRIPSDICRGECNVLVNTRHHRWQSASHEFQDFRLDSRLRS